MALKKLKISLLLSLDNRGHVNQSDKKVKKRVVELTEFVSYYLEYHYSDILEELLFTIYTGLEHYQLVLGEYIEWIQLLKDYPDFTRGLHLYLTSEKTHLKYSSPEECRYCFYKSYGPKEPAKIRVCLYCEDRPGYRCHHRQRSLGMSIR